jgi:hypothetical protein
MRHTALLSLAMLLMLLAGCTPVANTGAASCDPPMFRCYSRSGGN